jgi:hypothetical protein
MDEWRRDSAKAACKRMISVRGKPVDVLKLSRQRKLEMTGDRCGALGFLWEKSPTG